MQNFIRSLNSKLSVFFVSIAVIIVAVIVFEQYMLTRQRESIKLTRLAGRHGILTQKLTKLAYSIEKDLKAGSITPEDVESLKSIAEQMAVQHEVLSSFIQTSNSNEHIDSLLHIVNPVIDEIVAISSKITANELEETHHALQHIHSYDQLLTNLSEQLFVSYQLHADTRMQILKDAQYILGIGIFIAIGFGVIYILLPSWKKLRQGNQSLETSNEQLISTNTKLQAAEQSSREQLIEIKQLNDDLAAKERQYRQLIESADNMIYELDENARFIFTNPTTERMTGFSREQLSEKIFWEIVHPNHKENVIQFYFQQRKRKQEHSYYEFPIITAKRKTIWIGQSVSMLFHEHDGLSRFSIISRDVTNLKMTQLKLENSEKLYRLVSTNSKDLVSLFNYVEDTPIRTYISPSVKQILGYTPEELIGKTQFDLMVPEDAKVMRENVHPIVQSGRPAKSEYRVYRKDRSIVWLESYAEPFFEDGKVAGYQTSARDITSRIENEAKLTVSRLKAEQATQAKSQFLSMMSHEIRTPLNGIIGLTNFLLEDSPSQQQLQYLKLLKFSGDNLLTIINDVLDFSKIEANEIHLEKIPFNLHELLENALQTLRIRASDKGIPLMLSYDSKLPEVIKGDPVRLSQIINNLVSNAIKFTNSGFVSVQVLYSGKADDAFSATFSVKDTGIGIAGDKLDYIFESFTQATTDTARKFGGTGLGLSITKRLVQLMGSDITVVSEPDKGTEFTFSLVLEPGQLASDSELLRSNLSAGSRNIHILLVDDNDVNLIVAANYLRKWGFTINTAVNGKEALDKIVQRSYNLVLMDLQMPEMDGYEATRNIRSMQDEYFKQVPIIALTASAMIEEIKQLSVIGINDYVSKPFNPADLHEKILQHALVEVPGKNAPANFSLDAYSGGDAETGKILALRMVDNLKELRDALYNSVETSDSNPYRKALHKMQTTVDILNDVPFNATLENLKRMLTERKEFTDRLRSEMELFSKQCNQNIQGLLKTIE